MVLIHGLWITAASWDAWAERYRAAGHEVLAPPWPMMDRTVAALRADPAGLATITVPDVVDHFARIAAECERPPILMGHSFGALIVQMLLDRGLGRAGVALHPAGPRGMRTIALSSVQALAPIVRNPANRHRLAPVTPEGFHASAANALTPQAAREAWERDIVPAPGRFVFDLALANVSPRTPLRVDWKRQGRAPLLVVAGGEDRMATPRYARELARRHRKAAGSITAYREYPGRSHYIGQSGWEEVADDALAWALAPVGGNLPAGLRSGD